MPRIPEAPESYLYSMYLVKTPLWLQLLYPLYEWKQSTHGRKVYLTFDDGPHPVITPFVLDLLAQYQAKASFFCIGKNVEAHPEVYARILQDGHVTGNHTMHHLNGWNTDQATYLADIAAASNHIHSPLFRPPYGRIKRSQARELKRTHPDTRIIMWDVLSADFDTRLTAEACAAYVIYHTRPGSVIVFHDSEKAWDRLREALPKVLGYLKKEGYEMVTL